jgi:hypothetical protein
VTGCFTEAITKTSMTTKIAKDPSQVFFARFVSFALIVMNP